MTELPRDEYWNCPNRQLAFALVICGCEWAPQVNGGPAVNTYTLGFIRQPRFEIVRAGVRVNRFKGVSLREAGQALVKERIPGNVIYRFEVNRTLETARAAWDAMAHEKAFAEKEGRAPEMPEIPTEMMAQVLYVASQSMKDFAEIPFVNRMMQVGSTMEGDTHDDGGKQIKEGAGVCFSLFGSKSLLDRLNV